MAKPVLFRINNNLGIGGITRRLQQVLPLLQDEYEVHVVTYHKEGVLTPLLQDAGITVHHVPLRGKWNPIDLSALARLLRDKRADIVHTHSFGGNISGILAAAMARVPVRLGQVHVRQQHWYGTTELRRKKQRLEEFIVHSLFTDKVIFPSRAAMEYFHAHCPISEKKLHLLHNGIRLPEKTGPQEKADAARALRERFNIPQDVAILGFVGRLTAGKGVEFTFSFMERLRRAGLRHCLVVVGSAGDARADEELKEQAAALGSGLIHFAGNQADPYRLYRAFDGFFFPSENWSDAMPGTALEAAAHGLPILARENPPMREIAEYYQGVHFMQDTDDPVETIKALYAMPAADTARLKENFSIQAMADRTKALYSELLTRKR